MKILRFMIFFLMLGFIYNCGGEKEKKEEKEEIKIGNKKEVVIEKFNSVNIGFIGNDFM